MQKFIDSAYEHINKPKNIDKDINSLVVQMVNFGGFFEIYPHYEYIFLNMLNEKPTHLSAQLHKYCVDFKEKNRKYFTSLIESIDLRAGVSSCDVENFLFMIQNTARHTISSFTSKNKDESQLENMARMIKIFIQGLKNNID